ncbi:MAG TPA: hypothetical protein VGF34_14675 [Stellaceae bacterium]
MAEAAPYLRETAHCDWLAIWRGPLRPLQRSYTVTITYVMRSWIGDLQVMGAFKPVVRLIEPTLQVVHPDTGDRVPHVYRDWVFPERSELCLYDPVADEWSSSALIADTIVPWACDWLACYEGWLATGEWTGGGRHPGDAPAAQAA